jgi:DNA recombination protein RmuC
MDAWQRNVLLVSPSTLLFVVRTVAHLWRQEAQSRNAQEIAKRGAELYDKLAAFVGDLEKVGKSLDTAQAAYGDAFRKFKSGNGNAIRQAEMLKQLGVKPSKAFSAAALEGALPEAGLPDEALTAPSLPRIGDSGGGMAGNTGTLGETASLLPDS